MNYSTYPTLLNRKAMIFASLNRIELVMLASIYLLLSSLGVGGIKALLINLFALIVFKIMSKKFSRGFFKHINQKRQFNWSDTFGGLYER